MTRTLTRVAALAVLCAIAAPSPIRATTKTVLPPPTTGPADLVAVPGNAKVTLRWSAVSGVAGYRVYRALNGVWATAPVATTTALTQTSYSLENGQQYSFKVAGYTSGGNGPYSLQVSAMPLAPPSNLLATFGDRQVTLNWQASAGATSYIVYRRVGSDLVFSERTRISTPPLVDTGLTNGIRYYYQLRAIADGTQSELSAKVSAVPLPPPPVAAPVVVAAAGNAKVTLTWNALPDATSYKIYRSATGVFDAPAIASTSSTTFKNTGLVNGATYFYTVAGRNLGGDGPRAAAVSATAIAPPVAPQNVVATAGDRVVNLAWPASDGAATYSVYRSTTTNRQSTVPLVAGLTSPAFVDAAVVNGPTYFYKVTASNPGGESPRSVEVSANPEVLQPAPNAESLAAFRLLRQSTWGPKPGDVDYVKARGASAFLDEQFAAPVSDYPNALFTQPVEMTQEHFMHLALTGADQLRQRVAWALHKIWVVSAIDVDDAGAIVTYQRALMNGAFGNYRDLMRSITLNPAMGQYLNLLNNRSQQVTGTPPNENYAREAMQLFTVGIPRLNPDGSLVRDGNGLEVPIYTETDVKALARIFTGWTFGDGNPATIPTRRGADNFRVPMEAVARYHDTGEKVFLGQTFVAGQTAQQDLDQALDLLFNHPNMAPFISRQLIQQLVTSNPTPAYVAAIAAVFADNGAGVRGDLPAVVRAILLHPEAGLSSSNTGKLSEPVLFIVSQLRALNATVTDHPFMSDKADEMGQKVFYPPSVFSYYSPGFRVRGTVGPTGLPLGGPEFQILTTVTALVRVNFTGALLGGYFGANVAVDYGPFTSRAADPGALVDYCGELFMGTRMSPEMRNEIVAAVRVSPASSTRERARTAIYLTLVAAQTQVDW